VVNLLFYLQLTRDHEHPRIFLDLSLRTMKMIELVWDLGVCHGQTLG